MTATHTRDVWWWFGRTSLVAALIAPMKLVLLTLILGPSPYFTSHMPERAFLAFGVEVFYLIPTLLILALMAAVGRGLGVGWVFRVMCVVLLVAVLTVTIFFTDWILYLTIEVVGQLAVAAVAIRYADALRRPQPQPTE